MQILIKNTREEYRAKHIYRQNEYKFADKLIATTFSKAELLDVFEQAKSRYLLDKVRMQRYARRRNRQDEVKKYIGEQ